MSGISPKMEHNAAIDNDSCRAPSGMRSNPSVLQSPVSASKLPRMSYQPPTGGLRRGEGQVPPATNTLESTQSMTSLLFQERNVGTHHIQSKGYDGGGELQSHFFMARGNVKNVSKERSVKFPMNSKDQLQCEAMHLRVRPEDIMRDGYSNQGSIGSLLSSHGSKMGTGQKKIQRSVSSVVCAEPGLYQTLLPDTHLFRAVGDSQNGPSFGNVADEIFAWHDAQKATHKMLTPKEKITDEKPSLELRQFERTLRRLQERGRQVRCRWKPNTRFTNGMNISTVIRVDEGDDDDVDVDDVDGGASLGDDLECTEGGDLKALHCKRHGPHVTDQRVSCAASQERIRVLKVLGKHTGDTTTLRKELKFSRREVEKARAGATVVNLLADRREWEESQKGAVSRIAPLLEDVAWGSGNVEQQKTPLLSLHGPENISMNGIGGDTVGAIVPQRKSDVLNGLLQRRKSTLLHPLQLKSLQDVRGSRRPAQDKVSLPLTLSLSSKQQQQGQSSWNQATSSDVLSSTHTYQSAAERVIAKRKAKRNMRSPWKPLPVKCGVGEETKALLRARHAKERIEELQLEVKHGEDIRRTRDLLIELLPERARLLEESLECVHGVVYNAMQDQRSKLSRKAFTIDMEERQQACFAYVNLLENLYQDKLPEKTWPDVAKLLQKTCELISVSPERCNIRSFQNIIRESFILQHLVESPVYEMVSWLAQLFDIKKSEFKSLMSTMLQELNQPRDYHARFREIDRVILGINAPVEKRIRVILRCCRFFLSASGAGHNSTPGDDGVVMTHDRNADRPEITVLLKSGSFSAVSEPVRASVNDIMSSAIPMHSKEGADGKSATQYYVKFMDQTFRLQVADNVPLEFDLQSNGFSIGSSNLRLEDCSFNARGIALFWMRVFSSEYVQGVIKLSIEQLGEKERLNKLPRK